MKTLHVNLARGWRGGERQTLLLLRGLRQAGEEPELLARAGEPLAERAAAEGIPVHSRISVLFRNRRRFAVIHAHEARALQWAALVKVLGGPPVVATRRVDLLPGTNWFTYYKYRLADRVVAISDHVRSVMETWGIDPRRLSVIPSAVPLPETRPAAEEVAGIRRRLDGDLVIGFVGALVTRHKDPLTLIQAYERVRRTDPRLTLLIVGDGADRDIFARYIEGYGVPGVCMTGFVDDPSPYYASMDIFVLPSRMEGLGTAVLDAFAWDLPVIAGRAGALPEIVRHGETGLLFEPGNIAELAKRLEWLVQHPEERRRMAAAAKKLLLERHSPRQMIESYRKLYREITAQVR